MKRIRRLLPGTAALFVALASGARDVGAQSCTPEKDPPRVLFVGRKVRQFSADAAELLSDRFFSGLVNGAPGVSFTNIKHLQILVGLNATRTALDGDTSVDFTEIAGALGSPFLFQLEFDETRTGANPVRVDRMVTGTLVNTRTSGNVRRIQQRLSNDDNTLIGAIDSLVAQTKANLLCDLLNQREHPVVPALTVEVTPEEVSPGGTVHVKVTLSDESDGLVQPGKEIRIVNKHESTQLTSLPYETSFFGVVEKDLSVGPDPGKGSITVTYTDSNGRETRTDPPFAYRVRNTVGDMQVSAPEAALHLGAGASMKARLTHDAAPVVGTTVSFTPSGGGAMATPAVMTDANGEAVTQFQAPTTNAVVDVTASAPAPRRTPKTGAQADLTATLTFVVDGGVTLNVNALDTVAGATSDVTADLVVGGTAIPGTDVTFTLSGAGALSASSAPTDAAGRAEVTWLAPEGNSSATITATTVVDGQTYTQSVTVHAGSIGGVGVKVVPRFGDEHSGWQTAVAAHHYDPRAGVDFLCSFVTLAGVQQNCRDVPDYGTTAADPPVMLQTDPAATDISHRMTVTHPDPNVVVVEFRVSNGIAEATVYSTACLELTIHTAGSLTVDADASAFTAESLGTQVRWPGSGGTFTFPLVQGGCHVDEFADSGSSMTSDSIDVAQSETLQLVIVFVARASTGAPPDGTYKFTLTFHPR